MEPGDPHPAYSLQSGWPKAALVLDLPKGKQTLAVAAIISIAVQQWKRYRLSNLRSELAADRMRDCKAACLDAYWVECYIAGL